MIVPFAAGGTSDVIARAVAEQMSAALGQPIVIENVAGAGGSTALARAARAEADGYTIAIGNAGTSAATYTIYPKLPFTPESFVPIAVVAKTFGIVALRKDFPAKNLQEFIAYAKKNPGKINLGHAGVGSSNFLICKSFVQAAGIDVTLVGYRGAAPALTDAIGGQIDGVCDAAASVSQAIDDKLVKGLVVGSTVRLATLPDLPTSAEAGLPEFEAQGWNGLFAPKGTPPDDHRETERRGAHGGGKRAGEEAFHDLSTVAPDANEHTPEVLAATGDARRRKIPQAAGREEVRRLSCAAGPIALSPFVTGSAAQPVDPFSIAVAGNGHGGDAGHDEHAVRARGWTARFRRAARPRGRRRSECAGSLARWWSACRAATGTCRTASARARSRKSPW